MLIAPPIVLRPKSVPWGPFRISTRSTSSRFWLAPIVRGEKYAVEVDADARVEVEGKVVLADAANRRREYRAVAREGRARQSRLTFGVRLLSGVDVRYALRSQRLRGERTDRDRDVLDVLLTPLRRDDDFLQRLPGVAET